MPELFGIIQGLKISSWMHFEEKPSNNSPRLLCLGQIYSPYIPYVYPATLFYSFNVRSSFHFHPSLILETYRAGKLWLRVVAALKPILETYRGQGRGKSWLSGYKSGVCQLGKPLGSSLKPGFRPLEGARRRTGKAAKAAEPPPDYPPELLLPNNYLPPTDNFRKKSKTGNKAPQLLLLLNNYIKGSHILTITSGSYSIYTKQNQTPQAITGLPYKTKPKWPKGTKNKVNSRPRWPANPIQSKHLNGR